MSRQLTTFQQVAAMNEAFGNAKGDPHNIDWDKVRRQFKNIGHEFVELMAALGGSKYALHILTKTIDEIDFVHDIDVDGVRDASRDIVVFADGGHHLMGYDADIDAKTVLDAVMTRFVKDEDDLIASMEKHGNKGVRVTYTEGEYPTKILKSGKDQPDAPKGKFLKSASYKEPVFYKA